MLKPLTVRYTRATPAAVALPGVAVVRMNVPVHKRTTLLVRLREQINAGEVNEVLIVGPGACTGWRIYVDRAVNFIRDKPEGALHESEQDQAAYRIESRP
ncbi:MAG TPA: hypothetical protein VF681_05765 [Abditibacteriaceae bacterium]|jgi:hypothetical protein